MRRVFFIRHIWKQNGPSDFLKKQELFGIHFVDTPRSTNPEEYTSKDRGVKIARRILETLKNIEPYDLICSSFDEKYLEVGPMDKAFGVQLRDFQLDDGRVWLLKVARHADKRRLHFTDFPMLLAGMPRQGTFGEWHLMRDQILSIYETGKVKRDYTALAPAQIEALCSSFLFSSGQMVCQSLPSGRTLKDIDIVGLDPGARRILVQVTFSEERSKVQQKAKALAEHQSHSPRKIFFAPNSMRNEVMDLDFISLEEVWDYWQKKSGGIFLNDFFGVD